MKLIDKKDDGTATAVVDSEDATTLLGAMQDGSLVSVDGSSKSWRVLRYSAVGDAHYFAVELAQDSSLEAETTSPRRKRARTDTSAG